MEPGDTSPSVYSGKLNRIALHSCAYREILILSLSREEKTTTTSFLRKLREEMKFWFFKSRPLFKILSLKCPETPPPLAGHLQNYPQATWPQNGITFPFPPLLRRPLSGRTGLLRRTYRSLLLLSYESWMWRWEEARPSAGAPLGKTRAQVLGPRSQHGTHWVGGVAMVGAPTHSWWGAQRASTGLEQGLPAGRQRSINKRGNISALLGTKESSPIWTCSHLSQLPQLNL